MSKKAWGILIMIEVFMYIAAVVTLCMTVQGILSLYVPISLFIITIILLVIILKNEEQLPLYDEFFYDDDDQDE